MGRNGILIELHRIAKRSAREIERQKKASERAYTTALRNAETAKKREQQAYTRAKKASAAEQKRLQKEARESHEASMAAEVECRNLRLAAIEEELEGILEATLSVDDFVDLNTLRVKAVHPPFQRQDLLVPSRPPLPIVDSKKPEYTEPPAPRGLLSFLSKGQHEKNKAAAMAKHQQEMAHWHAELTKNVQLRAAEATAYAQREQVRETTLTLEKQKYAADCTRREDEAAVRNRAVEDLITNLGYGTADAIEEYIGIVLSNAVYPEQFPINHDYTFDPSTAELRLAVALIAPDQFPRVKGYKYVKSSDEIAEIPFSAKACKDRYSGAIHQVALRVPHEIFEADRRGLISAISIEVGTHGADPATGRTAFIPFVAFAVSRDVFMSIELDRVQPAATLAHFGASVSKNPYALTPANTSGVRRS